MDDRNLELEAWLIEAAGEEMMANHLGPNWNKFNEEFGFYPNMGMTVADLVWQHRQAKVGEQAQEIANLKSLIQGHELRHQQNLSIKQKLTRRSEELQKRVDALIQKYKDEDRELKLIDEWEQSQIYGLVAIELEQALKGEKE
ncbi:hypothetical protein [Acinetobacter pittii]|uniref:hypothetical protein n=1 Tax=Acinetobacter pittii TaxID=48296 RepID=UPI00300A36AE